MKIMNWQFIYRTFLLLGLFVGSATTWAADYPPSWAHDTGPNIESEMGRELIKIKASIPYFPAVGSEVMNRREVGGSNKFRPAYADIPWRMLQKPNSVKILFIGQDGTHIAEAAGRPATAGFGGRAHDLANYFGVDYSAAFINTYAFTIQGQGSSRNTPYFNNGKVEFGNILNNGLWLISQDLDSPIVQWRNKLIDWIIRNNKTSLKMIVAFGGTARDSIGTYIRSKGGVVGARYSDNDLNSIRVIETQLKRAGGNNQFPVPLTKGGKDLYARLLGATKLNYSDAKNQNAGMSALREAYDAKGDDLVRNVFLTYGGLNNSGILSPAQIGGYDLDEVTFNGEVTRSLKGIKLDDDSTLRSNILIVQLPHPTFLSSKERELRQQGKDGAAFVSEMVAKAVSVLEPYADNGWKIERDALRPNLQGKGLFFGRRSGGKRQKYTYGRADIGPEYYDFGTPKNRMVSVSSAKRMSVKSPTDRKNKGSVILFGARNAPKGMNPKILQEMMAMEPNAYPHANDVWTSRPRNPSLLAVHDPGPGNKFAQMMKQSLNLNQIFATKSGKSVKSGKPHDIADFNIKSHPDAGDYGHYRGTFKKPKVIILADPDGYDSLMTARAATGMRGQFLHGLVKDIVIGRKPVGDDYLVINTVPFGMDGASKEEWSVVLKQTETYRDVLFQALVIDSDRQPALIIADGAAAASELNRILYRHISDGDVSSKIVIIQKEGYGNSAGIVQASEDIQAEGFQRAGSDIYSANIPRSHLSYYARTWEGTTGDRVVTSPEAGRGQAFFMVAPDWAVNQKPELSTSTKRGIRALRNKLKDNALPAPHEAVKGFQDRLGDTLEQKAG